MGRPKDKFLWDQVDGAAARWVCNHCHEEFAGSATRIRNHLSGAGNDISGCAVVPSHIRDEALKKNTRKRRPSLSVSPLRNSSSSTAAAPPPQHDPPPSSSNDPDPVTKSAAEQYVIDAFMKMLMAIGVSDAVKHPIVREFCKRAHQHGVPLSLLGNDPFVIGKSLFNIKHEVYEYMLMVKESWKTTGCTLIAYNLSEKKENFASGGEGVDVIGFYCPKGFIFVKAPPIINEAKLDVEIFKDALKQHQPSLEVDDLTRLIHHKHPLVSFNVETSEYVIQRLYVEPDLSICEYVCNDKCQVYEEIDSGKSCACLRLQIQALCMETCEGSKWANTLIGQAVQLHKLLLEGKEEEDALWEWYDTTLAKKGEKILMLVGEEKQFHLSIFLLIMRHAADIQFIEHISFGNFERGEIIKKIIHHNHKFWIEGRKLAVVLTLMLRIPYTMDTLVPTFGCLGMVFDEVESVLLKVNKRSSYRITKADEAFHFWKSLRFPFELRTSQLHPWYFLTQRNVIVLADILDVLEDLVKKKEELPQLRKDLDCCWDVFCRVSQKIKLYNFHPVKKHIYQLRGVDDYILGLNVRMMEEFKMLGDDIYSPIDINAWEWIPVELRTS